MKHVTSKDGTTIARERADGGPALVLVGGALTSRDVRRQPLAGPAPGQLLHRGQLRPPRPRRQQHTLPYAAQREIEDIDAVIDAARGHAYLYGISSGAVLALEAACTLPGKVDKLAL